MSPIDLDRLLDRFNPNRRDFMRTLVLGTAYAAPMIASFSMDGLTNPAAAGGSNLCLTAPNLGSNLTDLAIGKTASPSPVVAGSDLTYTVTVENCGSVKAFNVAWQDDLPTNAAFVSATQTSVGTSFTLVKPAVGAHGGTVLGSAPSMNPFEVSTFQIVVTVDP
jgi:uncharacterized repeat protein (TIGR01451 family)